MNTLHAAEVAREDAMGSSLTLWAWERPALMAKVGEAMLTLAPGTRIDLYTLEVERPGTLYTDEDVDAYVDATIHDGAEPVDTFTVPEPTPLADDASEAEREAWRVLVKARTEVEKGNMWGYPHYDARQVLALLEAVDTYAVEKALRIIGRTPKAAPMFPTETWTLVKSTSADENN